MRDRNLGYERQDRDFYPTPAWPTEALLRWVRLPNGIWEPCCGDGAMARVLESQGHRVVGTDLVDRGYGEGGTRLPDGIPAARWRHSYRHKSTLRPAAVRVC